MHVLRTHAESRALRLLQYSGNGSVGRTQHNLVAGVPLDQRHEGIQEFLGLGGGFVHLPICSDDFSTRHYLLVSASTPGNFLPSRNSSEAPPPVEMCVILSLTPAACTAATESPPPTIEVAPVFFATALATPIVPLAKGLVSKTPIGPFHTMVLAFAISAAYSSTVFGPISRPI